jgi:hypothetical protein
MPIPKIKILWITLLFILNSLSTIANDIKNLDVHSGTDKVSLILSGQINRAMLYADNSFNTRLLHVDNENSSSRISLEARADVTCDFAMGANLVAEIQSNASDIVDIFEKTPPASFEQRKTEVFIDSKKYGTLFLGHGPTRSDTTSENDLSGTDMVALGATIDSFAGGLRFRETAKIPGPAIGEVYSSMDGLGRQDRVRYDSPDYCGFSIGASHVIQNSGDIGLNFAGEIDGTQIQASSCLAHEAKKHRQVNGSISTLFPCGFNISFAGGKRFKVKEHDRQPYFLHSKWGWIFSVCDLGKSCFAVDFGHAKNIDTKHDRINTPGLFFVQNIDKAASEIYIGLRSHHFHRHGKNFKPIRGTMIGIRVRF